jgi:predicted RNA-binding protein with PIN domain
MLPVTLPAEEFTPHIKLWVIDGFNLLHACILKGRDRRNWWGAEAQSKVVRWLDDFDTPAELCVVFDAGSERSERCSWAREGAELRYAAHADDAIVDIVRDARSASQICVVSADRALRDRCRIFGCQLLRPWEFADLIQADWSPGSERSAPE